MTQTELARLLGVRDATVSDWFNRGTMPGGAIMLRLPELLGVDGHWLLTGKHRRAPRPVAVNLVEPLGAVSDEVAQGVASHLEAALDILRGRSADSGGDAFIRVRAASEDERRSLDALDRHQNQPPLASSSPLRNRG